MFCKTICPSSSPLDRNTSSNELELKRITSRFCSLCKKLDSSSPSTKSIHCSTSNNLSLPNDPCGSWPTHICFKQSIL
ncbi:unnamed protein product [Ilex paraguariensis]|uniref:Uncharacterized protein n=1 Tax=Ilex paraguariensis TaxID=185542 RepID=A0ABC8SAH7_9AQUA